MTVFLYALAGLALTTPSASAAKKRATTECESALNSVKDIVQNKTNVDSATATMYAGLSILAGAPTSLLSKTVLDDVIERLGQSSIEKFKSDQKVQKDFFDDLWEALGSDTYDWILGTQAQSVKKVALNEDEYARIENNEFQNSHNVDMLRGFGYKFLPNQDSALMEPGFLKRYLMLSEARQTSFGNGTPELIHEYENIWRRLVPENVSNPNLFSVNGTSANNHLYEVALESYRSKHDRSATHVEILGFEGMYAGVNGRMGDLHFRYASDSDLIIPNPAGSKIDFDDPDEVSRLEIIEKQALEKIKNLIQVKKLAVGGILIEPIPAAHGVKFYRSSFLKKLRKLCDKFKIPLFADEILSGGGRTGKFFSYQHYQGFEPDFVTFGKGLILSGVAKVHREGTNLPYYHGPVAGPVTVAVQPEVLLKAIQVIKAIHDRNLVENVNATGDYLLKKLKEKDPKAAGKGFLIYSSYLPGRILGFNGRITPYLTLTKDQVDEIFQNQ